MQAIGVLLFESTTAVVRGERAAPRINALKLPSGDEALFCYLEVTEKDGKAGTLVRVETRRRGGKKGAPRQTWSAAVLDEADWVLDTLVGGEPPSTQDVGVEANAEAGHGREVLVPSDTPVALILRRFAFSSDLRVNQKVAFEVASDVLVGSDIVIRRGAEAIARVKTTEDPTGWQSARTQIAFEYVSAASGTRMRVRGIAKLQGRRGVVDLVFGEGAEFALCAGTRFEAAVDGDQRIRGGRE
jgi:hypothetical protein